MRKTLKEGTIIAIKSQGLTVKGKVISAEHWGERDGWYIEMIDTDGNYRYWKQGQDGGELLSIEGDD